MTAKASKLSSNDPLQRLRAIMAETAMFLRRVDDAKDRPLTLAALALLTEQTRLDARLRRQRRRRRRGDDITEELWR